MVRRRKYGRTWWGRVWVEAMERIDSNTNRLPRGRTYANKGSVKNLQLKERAVTAQVQGRRIQPYQVQFHLLPFTERMRRQVIHSIREDPLLKAQLSLGRLPEEILEYFLSYRIHLLPTSWKDLKASCSCPDWANPCKHLAAVYYLLANEIDQDPFLLFRLRGLTPEELVEEEEVQMEREERPFTPYQKVQVRKKEEPSLPSLAFHKGDAQAIFSLLSAGSSFYPGDLKEDLLKNYRMAARGLKGLDLLPEVDFLKNEAGTLLFSLVESPSSPVQPDLFLFPGKNPDLLPVVKRQRETVLVQKGKTLKEEVRDGLLLQTSSFLLLLLKTPLSQAAFFSPSLRFLVEASAVAQALVESFSLLPLIQEDGRGNFSIGYSPFRFSQETETAFQYLVHTYPEGLVFRRDGKVLPPEAGVEEVLSVFLTGIIHAFSMNKQEPVYRAFFKGEEYRVEGFAGSQVSKALSHWLSLLHMPTQNISPLLKVEPVTDTSFSLQVLVENRTDPLAPLYSLTEVFQAKEVFSLPSSQVQREVSRQLTLAGDSFPPLKEILSSQGEKILTMDSKEMLLFIEEIKGIMSLLGLKVMLPKEMKKILTPKASLTAQSTKQLSFFNVEEVLDFSWQVALGDQTMSKEEFQALCSSTRGIVRFRDRYVLLSPREVKKIFSDLEKPLPSLNSSQIIKGVLQGQVEETPFFPGEKLQDLVWHLKDAPPIQKPPELKGDLRPYQVRGYQWLYANITRGFGICLADDMGLGKTIQALALILKLKEEGALQRPALIICPTTLVGNWYREGERFAPSLCSTIYHGQDRRLSIKGYDLIITTYGLVRQEQSRFCSKDWGLIIIDEAQNIKNPRSQQSKAVKSLKGNGYLALTGTPMENRLMELWSIFDFLNKNYLGSQKDFLSRYALPIERYMDGERIQQLKAITSPFIMRRLKGDEEIQLDLPEKVVENEYCSLTSYQGALYQQVVDGGLTAIQEKEGVERRGLIFQLMTALKQICNHPVQYSKKGVPLKEHSGKMIRTLTLLEEILSYREKALIFTQYREMGEILTTLIEEELQETPLFFHGSLNRQQREEMVRAFQEGSPPILIISLRAGGTGLNLTRASHVIHYDLWWNPAVEDQATDRSYRIGQTNRVLVKRLITFGTFEEKIDRMMSNKRKLSQLTLSHGEKWITEFSNRELKDLFALQGSITEGEEDEL